MGPALIEFNVGLTDIRIRKLILCNQLRQPFKFWGTTFRNRYDMQVSIPIRIELYFDQRMTVEPMELDLGTIHFLGSENTRF